MPAMVQSRPYLPIGTGCPAVGSLRRGSAISTTQPRAPDGTTAAFLLDQMPLFIATCCDARSLTISRDTRVNLLLGPGHFLSRFHHLCLLPLFIAWQQAFDVSFAELGLVMAVMSATAVLLQTPLGFFVDRYGARPFLVGGTLLMTLSMAAVGFATTYWQVVVLALLSGVGNSVFHPPDYAILSGSIDATRLGRSFAFHTFIGNVGFGVAPPATAALMLLLGWRGALIFIGFLGLPEAAAIVWQSRILIDQARRSQSRAPKDQRGAGLLLSRSLLMFFAFFMVSSMAGAGIQSGLITTLHQVHGVTLQPPRRRRPGTWWGRSVACWSAVGWPTAPLAISPLSWL